MFRTKTARWIAFGALGALLVAAGVAVASEGGRRAARQRRAKEALLAREPGERARGRRERVLRSLRNLVEAPDEQVKVALEASRDLARIREEARAKAAAVVVQAFREAKDATPEQRQKVREATREKLRALRGEFRAPLAEAGMKVVKTLTPEQRKRIEEAARAKGRTVDDGRLALWFGRRLSGPWAEPVLGARLGER